MPFVWAKLLLGLATVAISVIILALLMSIAWLFKSGGVGAVMFIVWLILTGIVRFAINHYIGFLVKAGHIAVIAEAVTTGSVPENQVAYGKQAVKERFATSNIYFVLDKLVAGAVRQVQRVVGKVTGTVSSLPIPGMGAVSGLANFYISIALGYIDECCLGYTFYKKEQSAFKSAADGVVIFSQNIKALLSNAAKTMLIVVGGLVGIVLVLFLVFGLVFRLLSLPGWIGFIIAVFIALAVKSAFMDSFVLTRTMASYMEVAPGTELRFDLYENLCKVSSKFRELFNKGREEEGKPQIEAQAASPFGTSLASLSGLVNKGKEKLSEAIDTKPSADKVFCSECGKKNDRGSKFCNSCGQPLKQ
jgi:ABC-type multidrug transport system fused ATPase/permease subunit